jgi:hypothetical protein
MRQARSQINKAPEDGDKVARDLFMEREQELLSDVINFDENCFIKRKLFRSISVFES